MARRGSAISSGAQPELSLPSRGRVAEADLPQVYGSADAFASDRLEASRNLAQHHVADRMPVQIINLLEVIQPDEEH